jgi:recombinational DNA repair protein (RecF pathway)
VLHLQWAALSEAGYRPELEADIVSGGGLDAGERAFSFLPRLGGFSARPTAHGPAWRVRSETLETLRRLAGTSREAPALSADSVDRATRLLALYLREVLGRDMPSMQPLFGDIQA